MAPAKAMLLLLLLGATATAEAPWAAAGSSSNNSNKDQHKGAFLDDRSENFHFSRFFDDSIYHAALFAGAP